MRLENKIKIDQYGHAGYENKPNPREGEFQLIVSSADTDSATSITTEYCHLILAYMTVDLPGHQDVHTNDESWELYKAAHSARKPTESLYLLNQIGQIYQEKYKQPLTLTLALADTQVEKVAFLWLRQLLSIWNDSIFKLIVFYPLHSDFLIPPSWVLTANSPTPQMPKKTQQAEPDPKDKTLHYYMLNWSKPFPHVHYPYQSAYNSADSSNGESLEKIRFAIAKACFPRLFPILGMRVLKNNQKFLDQPVSNSVSPLNDRFNQTREFPEAKSASGYLSDLSIVRPPASNIQGDISGTRDPVESYYSFAQKWIPKEDHSQYLLFVAFCRAMQETQSESQHTSEAAPLRDGLYIGPVPEKAYENSEIRELIPFLDRSVSTTPSRSAEVVIRVDDMLERSRRQATESTLDLLLEHLNINRRGEINTVQNSPWSDFSRNRIESLLKDFSIKRQEIEALSEYHIPTALCKQHTFNQILHHIEVSISEKARCWDAYLHDYTRSLAPDTDRLAVSTSAGNMQKVSDEFSLFLSKILPHSNEFQRDIGTLTEKIGDQNVRHRDLETVQNAIDGEQQQLVIEEQNLARVEQRRHALSDTQNERESQLNEYASLIESECAELRVPAAQSKTEFNNHLGGPISRLIGDSSQIVNGYVEILKQKTAGSDTNSLISSARRFNEIPNPTNSSGLANWNVRYQALARLILQHPEWHGFIFQQSLAKQFELSAQELNADVELFASRSVQIINYLDQFQQLESALISTRNQHEASQAKIEELNRKIDSFLKQLQRRIDTAQRIKNELDKSSTELKSRIKAVIDSNLSFYSNDMIKDKIYQALKPSRGIGKIDKELFDWAFDNNSDYNSQSGYTNFYHDFLSEQYIRCFGKLDFLGWTPIVKSVQQCHAIARLKLEALRRIFRGRYISGYLQHINVLTESLQNNSGRIEEIITCFDQIVLSLQLDHHFNSRIKLDKFKKADLLKPSDELTQDYSDTDRLTWEIMLEKLEQDDSQHTIGDTYLRLMAICVQSDSSAEILPCFFFAKRQTTSIAISAEPLPVDVQFLIDLTFQSAAMHDKDPQHKPQQMRPGQPIDSATLLTSAPLELFEYLVLAISIEALSANALVQYMLQQEYVRSPSSHSLSDEEKRAHINTFLRSLECCFAKSVFNQPLFGRKPTAKDALSQVSSKLLRQFITTLSPQRDSSQTPLTEAHTQSPPLNPGALPLPLERQRVKESKFRYNLPAKNTRNIFICYAHSDGEAIADTIANNIENFHRLKQQYQINVWRDRAIESNVPWMQSLSHMIDLADLIIIVATDAALTQQIYGKGYIKNFEATRITRALKRSRNQTWGHESPAPTVRWVDATAVETDASLVTNTYGSYLASQFYIEMQYTRLDKLDQRIIIKEDELRAQLEGD